MTKYSQVNIRMSNAQKKGLQKDWKKFCQDKQDISFNAYVASFLKHSLNTNDPLTPLVPLGNSFTDERGSIQNILNQNITAVALITSKKGTVRSNHWHKSDWHYLYVVSGEMEYHERTLDRSQERVVIVKVGEMVFTAPGLVHKTVFLQDTVLLSLGNYVDHDADTVKQEF